MSELKNKDGIPLRVGQVWRECDPCKADYEIVFWHDTSDSFVCWEIGFGPSFEAFAPIKFDSMELVSDPIWGDMSEWRIVTEQEKKEHPKPMHGFLFIAVAGNLYEYRESSLPYNWSASSLWFKKSNFEWPTEKLADSPFNGRCSGCDKIRSECTCGKGWSMADVRKQQENKPQYRLFEIIWDGIDPTIEVNDISSGAEIGIRIIESLNDDQGYRIFGYTDSENWDKPGAVIYHNFPCDALSNRRYAIGRLEQN